MLLDLGYILKTMSACKIKITLFLIGLAICSLCSSQEITFTIKGKLINKSSSNKVFLQGEISETASLAEGGEFEFKGSLSKPGSMLIKTNNSYAWEIWVTNGDIDVEIEEYSSSMDSTDKKLLRLRSLSGPSETLQAEFFTTKWNALNKEFNSVSLSNRTDTIIKYFLPILKEYVTNHPNSELSAYSINRFPIGNENKRELLRILNRDINIEEAKKIEKTIAREELLKRGNLIANFEQLTLKGEKFYLNSLDAKYVLLEFWASDCMPCRSGNPFLVKTYNFFKNKGFEIVGISLDVEKKQWKGAVKKDKLPWIQVSDLKGWNNIVASKYFVDYIPFNILIDRNRQIIAINLIGESLSKKLAELLQN
jgi:thiol-disulfide isomerase/thioredoxin